MALKPICFASPCESPSTSSQSAGNRITTCVPRRSGPYCPCFDLGFVDMRKLVLFLLGAEPQRVHQFERVAQRKAALPNWTLLLTRPYCVVERFRFASAPDFWL